MTIAYWHEEYCTGNPLVDQQHQNLFKIVNSLHDAMMQGKGKQRLKETLDELIKYTVEHFVTEEKLMLQYNYPYYRDHKRKHDELTAQVSNLAAEFDEGNLLLNAEVLHFLNEWLIHHIKGEDLAMINFIRKKQNLSIPDYSQKDYHQNALAKIEAAQALIEQLKKSLKSKS